MAEQLLTDTTDRITRPLYRRRAGRTVAAVSALAISLAAAGCGRKADAQSEPQSQPWPDISCSVASGAALGPLDPGLNVNHVGYLFGVSRQRILADATEAPVDCSPGIAASRYSPNAQFTLSGENDLCVTVGADAAGTQLLQAGRVYSRVYMVCLDGHPSTASPTA